MEDLIEDKAKLAETVANDALRALLKVTNNHPMLAQGTPQRRELVRYIKRAVDRGDTAMSCHINIELTRKSMVFGFCTSDPLAKGASRYTLSFEKNKYKAITVNP